MLVILMVAISREARGWLIFWTLLLTLLFGATVFFFTTVDPGRMIYFVHWISVGINLTIIIAAIFLIVLIVVVVCMCILGDDEDDDLDDEYKP